MTQQDRDDYLTPEEAASFLGISRRTFERWVEEYDIQRYRQGLRKVRFRMSDVKRLGELRQQVRPEE